MVDDKLHLKEVICKIRKCMGGTKITSSAATMYHNIISNSFEGHLNFRREEEYNDTYIYVYINI